MKHRHLGPKVQYRTRKGKLRLRKRPIHKHITLIFSDGKKRKVPFVEPMRPKQTDEIPKGKRWGAEEKKDGSLTYMYGTNGKVAFANRRGIDKTRIYPELSDKEKLNTDGLTIVQGETYALKGRKDNFDAFLKRDLLQDEKEARRRMNKYPLKFEGFDILMKNNKWVTDKPLSERKKILEATIPANTKDVKLAKLYHNPTKVAKEMKKDKTIEGIVFKDLKSTYKSGKQNDWKKLKFMKTADTIIIGYNKGKGKRKSIGALNVGVWDNKTKKVKEVAKVGTGFSDEELANIKKRIDKGEKLFASVNYLNLGSQARLRAPSFKGLREDIILKETHI